MPGKVTLYVRDDELWARARKLGGRAGLSDLVQQCLRDWLDRLAEGSPPASVLERARQIRDQADALVRTMEREAGATRASRKRHQ
jgi:hypothetical protein